MATRYRVVRTEYQQPHNAVSIKLCYGDINGVATFRLV